MSSPGVSIDESVGHCLALLLLGTSGRPCEGILSHWRWWEVLQGDLLGHRLLKISFQAMVQLPQKCVDLWQELLQAVFFGGIGLLQVTLSGSSEI